jgi:hypothetical protein
MRQSLSEFKPSGLAAPQQAEPRGPGRVNEGRGSLKDTVQRCKFRAVALAWDRGSVEEFTMDKSAILILSMLFGFGTNAAVPSNAAEPSGPMDSVTVRAHREKLRVLSARMVKLEDQIYSDYNKLNPHPQYNRPHGGQSGTDKALFCHSAAL